MPCVLDAAVLGDLKIQGLRLGRVRHVLWTGDFCHVGIRREMGAYEIHCATCKSHMGRVFHGEHHTKNNERH